MGDQYELVAFAKGGPPPPPPPATNKEKTDENNHYEVPIFVNKAPPPPAADGDDDDLASHKLSNKNKKDSKGKLKKNKRSKKSAKKHTNDEVFGDGEEPNDPTSVKKMGASKSLLAVKSGKYSSELKDPTARGYKKPKKTAQEIIAEREAIRTRFKRDLKITGLIIGIAVLIGIISIIGIGAATSFNFGNL